MTDVLLNVSDVRLRSRVNGPGQRSVVWVQGCTIRCPGCFNSHTHAHRDVRLLDPCELGRKLANVPDLDGITISGGEPFEQAEACAILAEPYRAGGRSVMIFSGYTCAQLRRAPLKAVKDLLTQIDILVAGPYVAELATDGHRWRASANQRLHLLTGRGREAVADSPTASPLVEIATDGRQTTYTGFPSAADRRWMENI